MFFIQLPDDVLALVSKHVVRNGEAYWLAAASRAARIAVHAACDELNIQKSTSQLSTTFASLSRIRASMRLTTVSLRLLAHDVPGCENLPQSLDKLYRWSPSACRAMLSGGTVDVLNYVWPQWQRSTDPMRPACALVHICAIGRTDLLGAMFEQRPTSPADMQALSRLLRLAVEGLPAACDRVLHGILVPIVSGPSHKTSQWLYDKLEETQDQLYTWRTWLSDERRAGVLVDAACKSHWPFVSLRLLTEWLMPRFASRAPSERIQSMDMITKRVLVTLSSGVVEANHRHCVWDWLLDTWPLGLAHLLRHMHATGGPKLGEWVSVAMLHRNCLRVRDLTTYKWMRAQIDDSSGWMREVISNETSCVPWTVSRELTSMRHEAWRAGTRFAWAHHVFWYLHGNSSGDSNMSETRHRWALDRATVVETYADMLLYDISDQVDPSIAAFVIEVSVSAFADALKLFSERTMQARRSYVFRALVPTLLLHMQRYYTEPDDSDDATQRSAAWHYISSLCWQYSKDHPEPNGSV